MHDLGVGVEFDEVVDIGHSELPQHQPLNPQPLNDPNHPDDLLVEDVASGETRSLVPGAQKAYAGAAYAPDGRSVAVTSERTDGEQRLAVIDVGTGRERWSLDLGHRELGGTGAWSPDGRRLAILAYQGCTLVCDEGAYAARRWRIEFLDATTGASAGAPVALPGRPIAVLGWRNPVEPVLSYTPAAEVESWHAVLVAVGRDGKAELLVDTADEVTGIEVPRQLIDANRFDGAAPRPSPFAAQWWAFLPVGLLVLAAMRYALRRYFRLPGLSRRSNRAPKTPPPT